MSNQDIRQSNIEVLRIVAMFMILLWHAWGHYEINLPQYPFKIIVSILRPLINIHVDIFVLISGYFGLKMRFKSIFTLYTTVLFYTIILFTYTTIMIPDESIDIFSLLFPITHGDWWFIKIYTLLLFISPLLNVLIDKCNINKSWKLLLFIVCSVNFYFSYIQKVDTIYHYGYDLSNFICLYIIGRYIYYHSAQFKTNKIIGFTFFLICFKLLLHVFCNIYSLQSIFRLADYCNPLNVMLAATVLSLIIKWKSTWTNKTINSISTSTLAVYLITDNHIMREYLKTWTNMYYTYIPVKELYFPTYILILIILFIICILIDKCRLIITRVFIDRSVEYMNQKNLNQIWKL